jgi:hypothetical protein
MERDIGETDVREWDIGESDVGETVATCRFAEQLLIHIYIRGVFGYLSISQTAHPQAWYLRCHKPLNPAAR